MALCEMHLSQDNALGKMTSLTILTPECAPGPWPVLYLLHGLSDNHTAWTRRTSLERYVDGLPLMVVMPDGGRSFYTDAADLPRMAYETFLTRDVVGFVDRTFQTLPARAGRALAGLSMGGYGAVKLAFKHPQLFCAAASHSGAVEFGQEIFAGDDERSREWRPIMGASPHVGNDLFALAKTLPPEQRPALRVDCGVDDFLIEHNRRFHAFLETTGYPHEYAEHPGAHNWPYWDRHILDTLAFVCRALGLPDFQPQDHLPLG